jgi:hypothetical protein
VYPERVLAIEKKPIRVFLYDGRNDNRGLGRDGVYYKKRDWFFQNVQPMKALTKKGYDVNYTRGYESARVEIRRGDHAGDDALAVARRASVDRSERHGRAGVSATGGKKELVLALRLAENNRGREPKCGFRKWRSSNRGWFPQ